MNLLLPCHKVTATSTIMLKCILVSPERACRAPGSRGTVKPTSALQGRSCFTSTHKLQTRACMQCPRTGRVPGTLSRVRVHAGVQIQTIQRYHIIFFLALSVRAGITSIRQDEFATFSIKVKRAPRSEPCNIARSCTAVCDASITRAATQAWRFVRTQHNVMRSHQ